MRWKVIALGISFLSIFVIGVLVGRRGQPPSAPAETPSEKNFAAVRVETMTVQPTETLQTIEVTGTVKASLTADIAPKIMSKVAAVYVKEGDRVHAGQVLVRLESADLAAQVRQAEAAVASARAALAQAQTGLRIQRTQSSTRVEQAKAALRQAKEQLSLVREGARRQQKFQADEGVRQAKAAKAQAEEAVRAAEAEKLQAEEGVRQAEAMKAQAEEGVRQAEAALAAAKEQLSLVREGARRQQKAQAMAALRQAEANLRVAQATYERFKPLAEEGVITKQRFDEISLQLDVAKAQYETAKEQASMVFEGARTQEVRQAEEAVRQAEAALAMAQQRVQEAEAVVRAARQKVKQAEAVVKARIEQAQQAEAALRIAEQQRDLTYEGARKQEIRQAEEQVRQAEEALRMALAATDENKIKSENVKMLKAQLQQAEANLAAARVQLSYATIVAPFSGVVVKRHVDPGAMATPGVPVITLVDASSFHIESLVPESQLIGIQLGEAAQVRIDAIGQTLIGRVSQIVPNADPASRTFIVKVGLPKVAGLSSGLFGRVKFVIGKTKGIFVPESALWRRGSLVGVFVLEDGIAKKRLVTVGKVEGGKAEILSGLKGGEIIVVHDVDRLTDGAKVEATNKPPSFQSKPNRR